MPENKTGLVITAHPGDFVWRAGGAIALHAKRGYRVKIVCLSFGERGESQFAWKEPGATLEKVKAGRKDEAERAAALLGAEIEFFDCGDYPLKLNEAAFRSHGRHLPRDSIRPSCSPTRSRIRTISIIPTPRISRRKRAWWRRPWGTSRAPNTNTRRRRCSCSSRTSPRCATTSPTSFSRSTRCGSRNTRPSRFSRRRSTCGPITNASRSTAASRAARNTGVPMTYGEAYQRLFPTVEEILK